MSAIRHPNIVLYLGMFRDPDTRLPMLLMELMDYSLTHFLESSTQPIPYQIQVNICHDVTLALSFLHSNKIVHRDLSSNNVLLRGNVLAKVTDFGMARLGDINPQATRFTNTMCPGTDVYMPPEAVQDKPVCTEKIDCFSFGVIIVQILTRQFPKPGDRLERIELNHPGLHKGSVLVEVPEIDRRQNHISQVDPNHSLLPIALDCLKDEGSERPSTHQLCERMADLKTASIYKDNARNVQESDQERQIGLLNEKLKQLQLDKDRFKDEKERQLGHVNQQLEASEKVVARFERRIAELEQLLSETKQQKTKTSSKGKEQTRFKLRWRQGERAPCGVFRCCDAVVDGNTVYVMQSKNVYSYVIISDSWSQLPNYGYDDGSITVINGWLTAVGGYTYPDHSNDLFSLTGEGSDRKWTKKFPPMPTKRRWTTSLCTGTTLIVAGGWGVGTKHLSTVEVMDTETNQWSTAADLPAPMRYASATVCGDQLYLLGGVMYSIYVKSAYTSSVSALLQSCVLSSLEEKQETLKNKAEVWRQVVDLPVTRSTCESFHGRLLAIGGEMDLGKPSTAVYMYDSSTNSWEIISHMTTARYDCFTAVLPDNQLMVVGGYTAGGTGRTNTVELATMTEN